MAELVWKGKTAQSPMSYAHVENLEPQYQLYTQQYYQAEGIAEAEQNTDTWYNRLIYGDKAYILPALYPEFLGSVKLIYIDPPFMTGRTFTNNERVSERLAYHDTWQNDLDKYLQWLYETFAMLYQLLANDGSLYVHLDWHASHYAKIILDEIFASSMSAGGGGFKNEIIWHYQSGGRAKKSFARKHDTIYLYTKSDQYCFHGERVGQRRGAQKRNHMRREETADGRTIWTIRSAGRTYIYDEDTPMSPPDVWSDISHLHQRDPERTGYATQKPLALLERIILASSEKNDLVLDCFCGSGVTPLAAEMLGRRWLACDKSDAAVAVTRERLLKHHPRLPFALQYVEALK